MTEPDTFDRRLEALLADRSTQSIDSAQCFEHVVRRARRRIARRRIIAAAVVSGFFAAAAFVAVTAGPGRSAPAPLQDPRTTTTTEPIPTIQHPTFAVFNRPATIVAGRREWPAVQFDGGRLAVYKDPPCDTPTSSGAASTPDSCTGSQELCISLTTSGPPAPDPSRTGYECSSIAALFDLPPLRQAPEFARWGMTSVQFVHGQPVLIYGVVPDVVSRVIYAGRDVPITNNAFVITHPEPVVDRSQGLPLYYFIGDCRSQADFSAESDDGENDLPTPYRRVTCGTTTTPSTLAR